MRKAPDRSGTPEERIQGIEQNELHMVFKGTESWVKSKDSWLRDLGLAYREEGKVPDKNQIISIFKFLTAFTCGSRVLGAEYTGDMMDSRATAYLHGLTLMGYKTFSYYNGDFHQHKSTIYKLLSSSAYAGRQD